MRICESLSLNLRSRIVRLPFTSVVRPRNAQDSSDSEAEAEIEAEADGGSSLCLTGARESELTDRRRVRKANTERAELQSICAPQLTGAHGSGAQTAGPSGLIEICAQRHAKRVCTLCVPVQTPLSVFRRLSLLASHHPVPLGWTHTRHEHTHLSSLLPASGIFFLLSGLSVHCLAGLALPVSAELVWAIFGLRRQASPQHCTTLAPSASTHAHARAHLHCTQSIHPRPAAWPPVPCSPDLHSPAPGRSAECESSLRKSTRIRSRPLNSRPAA